MFSESRVAAVFVGGISISGGKGNLIGVILGVLIIGIINNGMSLLGANTAVQGIVKGVIINVSYSYIFPALIIGESAVYLNICIF